MDQVKMFFDNTSPYGNLPAIGGEYYYQCDTILSDFFQSFTDKCFMMLVLYV